MRTHFLFIVALLWCCYSCNDITEVQSDEIGFEHCLSTKSSEDSTLRLRNMERERGSLTMELNMLIDQADLIEERLVQTYIDLGGEGKEATLEQMQQRLYTYITGKDSHIGRVYKDLRISKYVLAGCKVPFGSDERVESYYNLCGVPVNLYRDVCYTIHTSYAEMMDIIYRESEKESGKDPDPSNPSGGSSDRPKIYYYTLPQTLENTYLVYPPLEDLGYVSYPMAPVEEYDLIDLSCLIDRYQDLYTYRDFSCSDYQEAETFRSILRYTVRERSVNLLLVVVSNGDSHTMYMFWIDSTYQVRSFIEVAIWHGDCNGDKYLIKDWMINDRMELIVGELKTNSPVRFEDDFSSLTVEKVFTKYDVRGGLGKLEQKSFGSQVMTKDMLRNINEIADNF